MIFQKVLLTHRKFKVLINLCALISVENEDTIIEQLLHENGAELKSLNYPNNYKNHLHMTWSIKAQENFIIALQFLVFNVSCLEILSLVA